MKTASKDNFYRKSSSLGCLLQEQYHTLIIPLHGQQTVKTVCDKNIKQPLARECID